VRLWGLVPWGLVLLIAVALTAAGAGLFLLGLYVQYAGELR
jgi:hypothetical protein